VSGEFGYPLAPGTYRISQGFKGAAHQGIDYAAPLKTPIYAAGDGLVVDSRSGVSGFGCWIVIDHVIAGRKVSTVYGHMYAVDLLVPKGARVVRGQHISNVGQNGQATGPHLHFEVWEGGRLTGGHAVDPTPYLSTSPAPSPSTNPGRLSWILPSGHYIGRLDGPANCHGGDARYDSDAIRRLVQNTLQWFIYHDCVPGVSAGSWATSSWPNNGWVASTVDPVAKTWHDRFYPGQQYPYQIWSDDYAKLSTP
jgi:hypothetical protein